MTNIWSIKALEIKTSMQFNFLTFLLTLLFYNGFSFP